MGNGDFWADTLTLFADAHDITPATRVGLAQALLDAAAEQVREVAAA
ncbi:hypothetical protein [Rhizobium sp. CF142]|nr:hypothetical protein [Rhizobium sp. CF142]